MLMTNFCMYHVCKNVAIPLGIQTVTVFQFI